MKLSKSFMKKLAKIPVLFMILFAKLIPFNWIVGSYRCTFSLTTIFASVLTKYFGFGWILLFFISNNWCSAIPSSVISSLSHVISGLNGDPVIYTHSFLVLLFFSLLHRTPLLFAAYAYRNRHWATSLLTPAFCLLLFVIHEVGSVAWCYSLYWLIPIFLYFIKNSLITRALTASFVAHGVGSVIWLYAGNIPAEIWIGLIPVVVCERLLMAGGMLALDFAITRVRAAQSWQLFCKKLGFA